MQGIWQCTAVNCCVRWEKITVQIKPSSSFNTICSLNIEYRLHTTFFIFSQITKWSNTLKWLATLAHIYVSIISFKYSWWRLGFVVPCNQKVVLNRLRRTYEMESVHHSPMYCTPKLAIRISDISQVNNKLYCFEEMVCSVSTSWSKKNMWSVVAKVSFIPRVMFQPAAVFITNAPQSHPEQLLRALLLQALMRF